MNTDLAMALCGELIWTAVIISAPVLLLAMLVGLVISIFQVVTQIQEMTLTFVPKLLAVGLTLIVFGPWMISVLLRFATTMITNISVYI